MEPGAVPPGLVFLLLLPSGRNGDLALAGAGGTDGDLHVLPESDEEFHEALDGEGSGAIAHQRGDVRLADAKDSASFGLGEAAAADDAVDLQGEPGADEFALRVGQAEVGEDIAGAQFSPDLVVRFWAHASSASPGAGVRLPPGGGE